MSKLLSVVALFFVISASMAQAYFDPTQLKTKDIVRAKLWYQGMSEVKATEDVSTIGASSRFAELPEEVSVALRILERE